MSSARPRWDKPALVVLAAGLITTVLIGLGAWRDADNRARLGLAEQGALVEHLLAETIDLGITQVRSLQAFFEASEQVTAVEFARFALHQGGSPGMTAIGFAPVLPPDEFPAFADAARRQRSWYVVVGSDRRPIDPPVDRPVVPVWYAYQHRLGPGVLGLDLADNPDRLDAILRSLASGRPAVTTKIGLLGDPEPRYLEVYSAVRKDSGGRPGVAFATLDLKDLANLEESVSGNRVGINVDVAATGSGRVSSTRLWRGEVEVGDRVLIVELSREAERPNLASLLAVAGGVLASIFAANVTQLRLASRRREREMERLVQGAKEKDIFLASVAHELRTPLTSVVAATALLAKEWRNLAPEEIDELLGASHAEATDLGDLIEDLLVAGRLDAGAIAFRPESMNLSAEVARVAARLTETVSLTHHDADKPVWVLADPLRVRQIIRNLLVNGARHAHTKVEVKSIVDGDRVLLTVSNDGPPVPAQILDVLFNPYQNGVERPRTPGSIGLGMPVSQRLAKAMGGEITYHYQDGWSRFCVELPATDPPSTPATHQVAEVAG